MRQLSTESIATMISRRTLLKGSLGAAIYAAAADSAGPLEGKTLHIPLGLQLYSLRETLPQDFDGILRKVAGVGYREVEAAGFFNYTAAQVKQSMAGAGLNCVSAHYAYGQLKSNLDGIIQYASELGLKYVICSSPGRKDPSKPHLPHSDPTLEDWRWNADEFNRFGEKFNRSGIQFGYHNHVTEFHEVDGVLPYNELLRLTDPGKVTMELDCGWMVVGGQSPAKYLTDHPTRFSMLHLKDFKRGQPIPSNPPPPPTELGRGSIDYRPIFRAAVKAHIRHAFVEQEGFDIPTWESLKVDADYMRNLNF
jgi:sugar phosphate isomerase/epimerase